MARKVTITDRDRGFKKLAASLGEMGQVTIGVQGKEAEVLHDPDPDAKDNITIGHLAALHELGLGGQKSRSWCRAWMDANEARMVRETAAQFRAVLARTQTRNAALIKLGYEWTADMQKRMDDGHVKPPISSETAARKGHTKPLIDTYTLRDSITYKVWLPQTKSIRSKTQRMAVRKR